MMQQPNSIILECVNAVNSVSSENVTYESLEGHIHAMSMYVVMESRSEEEKAAIKIKLEGKTSPEDIAEVMLEYTTPEHYAEIYQKVTLKVITFYIENLLPTLEGKDTTPLTSLLTTIKNSS